MVNETELRLEWKKRTSRYLESMSRETEVRRDWKKHAFVYRPWMAREVAELKADLDDHSLEISRFILPHPKLSSPNPAIIDGGRKDLRFWTIGEFSGKLEVEDRRDEATAPAEKLLEPLAPESERSQPLLQSFSDVLTIVLSKEYRESFVGDIEEEYCATIAEVGCNKAQLWFVKQVLKEIGPVLWPRFKKLAGLVGLTETVRRWIRI